MQQIDFLPTKYRERDAVQKGRIWQLVVLLAFAAGVSSAAIGQYTLRKTVESELLGIEDRHATAERKQAEVNELQQKLAESKEVAALYTYLKFPWPRTQLISQIVDSLPEAIALTELTIGNADVRAAPTRKPPPTAEEAADEQSSPAHRDLSDLRKQHDLRDTRVELTGSAEDIVALHAYVAQLGQSPLFQSAKLDSLESRPEDGVSTFLVRLVVTPGYGQPGGPKGPLRPESAVAAKQSPLPLAGETPAPQNTNSQSQSKRDASDNRIARGQISR